MPAFERRGREVYIINPATARAASKQDHPHFVPHRVPSLLCQLGKEWLNCETAELFKRVQLYVLWDYSRKG